MQNKVMNVHIAQRHDLDNILGQDCDSESYDRMPISSFGMNLLKSMGWQQGKGIGKNPENALLEPKEFSSNLNRRGLGASRSGETSSLKKQCLNKRSIGGDRKVRDYIEVGAKTVKKIKKIGKDVQLKTEDKQAEENGSELSDLNEEEDQTEDCGLEGTDRSSEERKSKKKKEKARKAINWILPGIIVKVISRKVEEGRLYRKKVYVLDVVDEYSFSIIDDFGMIVEDIEEKHVETVIPEVDGLVKVLVGEHRDQVARVIGKGKERDSSVFVQLTESMEIKEYKKEECSKYM